MAFCYFALWWWFGVLVLPGIENFKFGLMGWDGLGWIYL